MDKESYIFSKFANSLNGDDCAVFGNLAVCKDLFCEDVHFKRHWLSPEQIATKSLLVNISDLIAMNAKPKFALIGLTLPRQISLSWIDEITNGFLQTAKKWGFEIIGGDTICGDKINISITMIGECENPIYRSGAKIGDLVAFSGNLGGVVKDLNRLLKLENDENFKNLNENEKYKISSSVISKNSKFITPDLRADFLYKSAKFINSALDLSDGLEQDLPKLLKASNVGVKFIKNLSQDELKSGEEYELLFTFSSHYKKEILEISHSSNTPITIFGEICKREENTKFEFKGKAHHF